MKKLLFFVVSSSFMMFSCNNEMDIVFNEKSILKTKAIMQEEDIRVVNYDGENCIKFMNDSVYREIISKIVYLPDKDKQAMFTKLGFKSQMDIMDDAVMEQEAIVDAFENSNTNLFPTSQINSFKEKYKDVFFYNPYDSTDFIPHYKISMNKSFTNKKGIFMIGDSVIKVPNKKIEEVFPESIVLLKENENTDYNSINFAETKYQIPGGDYVKVHAKASFIGVTYRNGREFRVFGFELQSKKKKVLWKRHHADVIWNYNLTGSMYNDISSNGKIYFNVNNFKTHVYGTIDEYPLGEVGQGASSQWLNRYSLSGKMEIWSNEIPVKGLATIQLFEN